MSYPTADEVARAIVEACRLTGEDPIAVAKGEPGLRARAIALDALLAVFDEAPKAALARCLAYGSPSGAVSNLKHIFRVSSWWRDDWVDEVVGAIVADQYGERAQ